ncbi:MAG: hypothetical protein ACRYG4_06800 [Janthinobacterium lividum]
MIRRLALLLLPVLALAACGDPPKRAPAAGQTARATVDAAMTAYAMCVYGGAKTLATPTGLPADIVNAAIRQCAPKRTDLVAKVRAFHRIGSPTEAAAYSDAVAEQSVAAMEGDLRSEATVNAVSRQLEQEKK